MSNTAGADLYGALGEEGINRFVDHMMAQRPSLFNYATAGITAHQDLLCHDPPVARSVRDRRDPTVTTVGGIPVLGTDGPVELEYCLQLTEFEFDLSDGGAFTLPDDETLADQEFGIHAQVAAGLGCPSDGASDFGRFGGVFDPRAPLFPTDRFVRDRFVTDGGVPMSDGGLRSTVETRRPQLAPLAGGSLGTGPFGRPTFDVPWRRPFAFPGLDLFPVPWVPRPDVTMHCFVLDAFVVGSVDLVTRGGQRAPEFELEHLQIATEEGESLDFPLGIKNAIECYLDQLVRLVLVPAVEVAFRESVGVLLDLPVVDVELTADDPRVSFPETDEIPNNPALEDDQLKLWFDLDLAGVGA